MDRLNVKRMQVLEALEETGADLTVGRIMTASPSCIEPDTSVLDLIRLFHEKLFRHLMVVEGGDRLVGVISDRDVLRCLGPVKAPHAEALTRISAADVMSTDLVTVGPDTPLGRAVRIILEQGISCLPILDDGSLVGILTNTDLHVLLETLLKTVRRPCPEESLRAVASGP